MRNFISGLLVCLILTGCATTNIKEDFSLNDSNQGVAVFSVTNDRVKGACETYATFYMNNQLRIESAETSIFGGGWCLKSEFDDSQGRLIAIALDPGDHELVSWKLMHGHQLYISPSKSPPPIKFSIREREVKYLGNLHLSVETGKGVLGNSLPTNVYPKISDNSSIDIEKFEEKYPQFTGRVMVSPLPPGVWVEGEY